MKKVCILNYGSGNVKSVYNLVKSLNFDVIISNNAVSLESATHIILPGVGSFGAAMEKIRSSISIELLENEVLIKNKPFLGICVGMQVLAQKGFEHGEHDGLKWISGEVKKLKVDNFPIPHIGWNEAVIKKESPLFNELNNINDYYFVHSYALETDNKFVTSETEYENNFVSSIQKDNIYGVQFHPEKSQKAGKKLLQNFLKIT